MNNFTINELMEIAQENIHTILEENFNSLGYNIEGLDFEEIKEKAYNYYIQNFDIISKEVIRDLCFQYGNKILRELDHLTVLECSDIVEKECYARNCINIIDFEIEILAGNTADRILDL